MLLAMLSLVLHDGFHHAAEAREAAPSEQSFKGKAVEAAAAQAPDAMPDGKAASSSHCCCCHSGHSCMTPGMGQCLQMKPDETGQLHPPVNTVLSDLKLDGLKRPPRALLP